MKPKDPFNTFDWYFSDASEDAARHQALKSKSVETSMVHFALWSELPNNHPVAELWFETQTDLHATIYLAYGGFFRQAFTVLRSWFEIAVHGVFFSAHYGQPSGRYELWRKGQHNAPANMEKIAASLAVRPDKVIQVSETALLQKLKPIYSVLAEQAHGKGIDIYDLQEGRDNVPRYLPKSFDLWYSKVLESFDALCFLYRIFLQNEIGAYLNKSDEETKRFRRLKKALSHTLPEFNNLAKDVLAQI